MEAFNETLTTEAQKTETGRIDVLELLTKSVALAESKLTLWDRIAESLTDKSRWVVSVSGPLAYTITTGLYSAFNNANFIEELKSGRQWPYLLLSALPAVNGVIEAVGNHYKARKKLRNLTQ